jgi:hypothetical protein
VTKKYTAGVIRPTGGVFLDSGIPGQERLMLTQSFNVSQT